MLRILCIFLGVLIHISTLFAQSSAPSFFEGSLMFNIELKGPEAEMLKRNEPNDKMQMHFKDGDFIVNLQGGRYPKTFLYIADSNRQYTVDFTNQLAYRYSGHADMSRKNERRTKAMPTSKTAMVNGIPCRIYRMRTGNTFFSYYVNDDYRIDRSAYPKYSRAKASFLAPGLEGRIPLKTIKRQKNITVITTLSKAERKRSIRNSLWYRLPLKWRTEITGIELLVIKHKDAECTLRAQRNN